MTLTHGRPRPLPTRTVLFPLSTSPQFFRRVAKETTSAARFTCHPSEQLLRAIVGAALAAHAAHQNNSSGRSSARAAAYLGGKAAALSAPKSDVYTAATAPTKAAVSSSVT